MIILRNKIDEHVADSVLFEAFQGVYAVHPNWEMPNWVVKKIVAEARQGKQDTPLGNAVRGAEGAES